MIFNIAIKKYFGSLGNQSVDHLWPMLQPGGVHVAEKILPHSIARSKRPAGATGHPPEVAPALISDCDDVVFGHGDAFRIICIILPLS